MYWHSYTEPLVMSITYCMTEIVSINTKSAWKSHLPTCNCSNLLPLSVACYPTDEIHNLIPTAEVHEYWMYMDRQPHSPGGLTNSNWDSKLSLLPWLCKLNQLESSWINREIKVDSTWFKSANLTWNPKLNRLICRESAMQHFDFAISDVSFSIWKLKITHTIKVEQK